MALPFWLRSLIRRQPTAAPLTPEVEIAITPSTTPIPAFIKAVAKTNAAGYTPSHELHHTSQSQDRDPGRALGCIRRRAAGASLGGRAGAWTAADAGKAGDCGLEVLRELEIERFLRGILVLEHKNGAEHDVRFDPATCRVIKMTQPGEFGAWGGLEEYLQRLAWTNEFFADDWLVEGWVLFPNESAPRH